MPVPYDSQEYWETRFQSETNFEWVCQYSDIQPLIHTHFDRSRPVLHLGCGSSRLGLDLYQDFYESITNVDFSDTIIEKMKRETQAAGISDRHVRWQTLDVLQLSRVWSEGSWTSVIDKSTLDALMCGGEEKGLLLIQEVGKILKTGGVWLCVSYSSDRERLFEECEQSDYRWRVQKSMIELQEDNELGAVCWKPKVYHYVYIVEKVEC
jgi:ubiquinone/menaquinone biosynthesis C-methylase UbiE